MRRRFFVENYASGEGIYGPFSHYVFHGVSQAETAVVEEITESMLKAHTALRDLYGVPIVIAGVTEWRDVTATPPAEPSNGAGGPASTGDF